MTKGKVWNVRDPMCPPDAVYIGRGTPYGNPFRIGDPMTAGSSITLYGDSRAIGEPMTRSQVISLFICLILPSLDVTALEGKDVKCHCHPQACHGDPITAKAYRGLEAFTTP